MPRYELSEGTSNKFWQIDLSGSSFTTTFGRIGAAGQRSTKAFATADKARAEYDKLIAEKTRKGYRLVGDPTAPATTTAPAASEAPPAAPARSVAAPERARSPEPPGDAPAEPVPAAPAPASPTPVPGAAAHVVMTDAARRAAAAELAALEIAPRTADNPIGTWLVDVYRPFLHHGKAAVQNGATRGDPDSQRLSRAVLNDYGSLERMPSTLDVETAAAALQLVVLTEGVEPPNDALVAFWVAHSGLGFALEAFVTSLWRRAVASDRSYGMNAGPRWLSVAGERTLDSLFAHRIDLVLHAYWRGASPEQRAAARDRLDGLRRRAGLLERSAVASCVLDPAWIDADLREHATTGARAMFSPEALLVASAPGDIAAYLSRQSDADLEFYTGLPEWPRRPRRNLVTRGYSHVERSGLAGIDLACVLIARLLPGLAAGEPSGATRAALIGELLAVSRLAHDHPPTVAAAIAVIDELGDHHLTKDVDPRPVAYDCLRGAPAIALPLVRAAARRGWAKNLLPQLERLAAGSSADDRPDAPDAEVPAGLRVAGKFKPPEFWQPAALSRIALRNGTLLPVAHLAGLATALKAGDRDTVAELVRVAEPRSLGELAWDLFQAWLTCGAPAKDKWAFTALGLLGDDEIARRITPLIRAWPGEAQHARAVAGLDVLGGIGSDVALMMLNGIAQKVKFKGLQEHARARMDEIAQRRGMTADELADRLVPDLDLEDDGSRTLDFGPRSFRVGFDEALTPFVVDAAGTRLRDLPRPGAKDDPALAGEAAATWKAMKQDVRALAAIQVLRLELAMGGARRWTGDAFRNFFVEHPLLTHLVRRLVWGVYAPGPDRRGGALQRTFRVAEDRSYADPGDAACQVDGDAVIGIVHRLDLSCAEAAAWAARFGDYELAQPFEQLARATYRLTPEERAGTGLARFAGRVVDSRKLLGLVARGWRKGHAQDGGAIYEVYKPIRPGLIASLPFETGLYASAMDHVEPTQTLGVIDFAPSEPSGSGPRADAIELRSIDDVVISEVIRDVEAMGPASA